MKFGNKYLVELSGEDSGEWVDGFEVIYNKIIDTTRWSEIHEQVFKFEDRFYSTSFSCGLTEYQDEQPYEYDGDMIECKEVFPKEVVKTIYVTKEKL